MVDNLRHRLAALAGAGLLTALTIASGFAQQLSTGSIAPDPPDVASRPYVRPSPAEMERIFHLKEELKERIFPGGPAPAGGPGLPEFPSRPTFANDFDTQYPGTPSALMIGRNNKNTNANNASKGSTLAEPSGANEGMRVLAAGNYDHAEYSTNAGATWTDIAFPAGPADAPTVCCDSEVVYDQARGVWILSTLYINSNVTNGVIRLFVFRTLPSYSCSYTIDPDTTGSTLPDFPHIGLSNNYLYLATNEIPTGGGQNAKMRRLNLDNMADCVTASTASYTWPSSTEGQRVWRPVQGATDTMYWAHHSTSTSLRVFSWTDAGAAPVNVLKTLTATTFGNPDCRGGTNNADWTDSTGWATYGFSHNGAVGRDNVAWYWNASPDASHLQGHAHGAVFVRSSLALLAQPAIYNTGACFGNVTVAMNERGDIGAQLSFGGKSGGGGAAAQGYVGIDDEFTTGIGQFVTVSLVASGTHNRTDSRYGDYFSVRQYEPCDLWFGATSYALSGGTSASNVNSRWVEFGRGRDEKCYRRWQNSLATP